MKTTAKRITTLLLAALTAAAAAVPAFAHEDIEWAYDNTTEYDGSGTYVSLGADLTPAQRGEVLRFMDLSEEDLADCEVVTVTNEEEREYLQSYIPPSEIGTLALSSVVVRGAGSGDGISVQTYNIDYCTEGMYSNALATAGVIDADVTVAAPSPISGTAALIGALEAYSVMTGEPIDPEVIDAAVEEIVITGEIEESSGYTDEVEGVITYLKDNIDAIDGLSDEEIDEEIRSVADSFGFWLDDEEVVTIREFLKKLKDSDIDWDAVSAQAQGVYDQLEEDGFDLGGLDVGDLGLNMDNATFVQKVKGAFDKAMDFFRGVFTRD